MGQGVGGSLVIIFVYKLICELLLPFFVIAFAKCP